MCIVVLSLVATAPARAAVTSVAVPIPSAGDISYAVTQVMAPRRARHGKARRATDVFDQVADGVEVHSSSAAWPKRKRDTRVYFAVSRVLKAGSRVRNVYVVVARRNGGSNGGGSVRVTLPGAKAVKSSFWVRSVSRSGAAKVFTVRNALATALGNWGRLLSRRAAEPVARVLDAAAARLSLQRVQRASDSRVAAERRSGPVRRVVLGGQRRDLLTNELAQLVFAEAPDRIAFQRLKRGRVVSRWISNSLRNPALGAKFASVANKLPLEVPDAYSAASKEERRFSRIAPLHGAQLRADDLLHQNASDQLAVELPPLPEDQQPGVRITVVVSGAPASSGRVVDADDPSAISCPGKCSAFYAPFGSVHLRGDLFGAKVQQWQGCTSGLDTTGQQCSVDVDAIKHKQFKVVASYAGQLPPDPATVTVTPAPVPSTTPPSMTTVSRDPDFGFKSSASPVIGLARQSTGSVLALTTGSDRQTVRLTADGDTDKTFHSPSRPPPPADATDSGDFSSFAVAADNSFYVTDVLENNSGRSELAVNHYTADGTRDEDFGEPTYTVGNGGIAQPTSTVVSGGQIYVVATAAGDGSGYLVDFDATGEFGQLNRAFGRGGHVIVRETDPGSDNGYTTFADVAVTANDVVVAGSGPDHHAIYGFEKADGTVDGDFGSGGIAINVDDPRAGKLAILPDGSILLGAIGTAQGAQPALLLAHYDTAGQPIVAFNGGTQTFHPPDFGTNPYLALGGVGLIGPAVVFTGRGNDHILLGGATLATGAPDTSLGPDGVFEDAYNPFSPQASVFASSPDGGGTAILGGGGINSGYGNLLRRYTFTP